MKTPARALVLVLLVLTPAAAMPTSRIPLGDFLGHAAPTLVQRWGLIMVVFAALAFARAWRLMSRKGLQKPR